MQRITIIGLGMIGASLGLALRARGGDVEVTGYDIESKVHNRAKKEGVVNRAEWSLPAAVKDADLVVLAVPVLAMRDLMADMASYLKPGATVTDTATTKRQVLAWAAELLPEGVGFVGGNPLAGGGRSGPEGARADLFVDATYAVLPAVRAPEESVGTVVSMVEKIGAKAFFVDPHEHDTAVAAVSHMPVILSSALMMAAAASPSWREISKFASDDFKAATSFAATDPEVSLGIASSNADMISHWIDAMISELSDLQTMIAHETRSDKNGPLMQTLVNTWEARKRYEAGVTMGDVTRPALPSAGDGMMQMFLGDRIMRVFRDADQRREDPTRYRR